MTAKPTYEELRQRVRELEKAEAERRQAVEALRASEERYKTIVSAMSDLIFVIDEEDRFVDVHCKASAALMVPPEHFLGKTMSEMMPPHVSEMYRECASQLRQSRDDLRYEYSLSIQGETKHFRASLGKHGDGSKIVAVVEDITERKQAEEALQESESFLSGVFNSIQEGLSVLDNNLNIIRVNRLMEEWYAPNMPLVGKKCFACYHDALEPCDACPVLRSLLSGEVERETVPGLPGSSVEWVELYSYPMRNSRSGEITGVVEFVRNITEHKRAQEERERLQSQLSHAQKMEAIGSLAGGVAHDLNNLLSPILGFSEMLREELDPEDSRRSYVDETIQAGLRARDLVRQLLAFSRKQILEFRPVDLNSVASGLRELLRRTIREDIEMELDLAPDVGVIMADGGQIEQVIINLCVNAADAMQAGGKLTIETSRVYLDAEYAKRHQSAKPGHYVMLAVSDTGCGMDEATRENAFDPFFSTKGELGTGLGLSTVYGIVKQHGGNIWLYSELGKGTTFKIYLPLVEAQKPEGQPVEESGVDLQGSETILVVEDSDQVRRLAALVLERCGYQVLMARNGDEALAALASHPGPVHLMLTDVVMPGMNGKELYERAVASNPSLKVLYMSGYTENVIAHSGLLKDGIQFIQKPFTINAMAARVREVLAD